MTFGRGRGGSIRICFLVMVMWKMVEGLKGLMGVRMEGDTIFGGGVKVLKDVEGSFVVLMGWASVRGGQKGECRGHIWPGTCGQPIDTANNTLITFCASFQVGIFGVRRWDGIDGHTRPIRSHVGDRVEFVDGESMGCVLGEG